MQSVLGQADVSRWCTRSRLPFVCVAYMLFHMKTTIDIDDELYQAAKSRADAEGKPLVDLVEEALREFLCKPEPYKLKWITTGGELKPGVDISSRDSLYDAMDGLSNSD